MASGPQTRRRLPAGERRAAILRAALEVFASRGFHAASIDDIAQAAGISKALIYEHFESKQQLYVSLLEAEVADLFARLAASAGTDEPGDVRLRAGIDAFLGFVEERRGAFRMLFRAASDAQVTEVLARVERQATDAIAALMASEPTADTSGEDDPLAIEMLAQQLSGAMQSLAIWWEDHQDVPRERVLERAMGFAWLGLERLRAGERST